MSIAWKRLEGKKKRKPAPDTEFKGVPPSAETTPLDGPTTTTTTTTTTTATTTTTTTTTTAAAAAGVHPHADDDDDWELRHKVDKPLVKEAYCNIVAGACFALGLRFAGTADAEACALVTTHCRAFQRLRDADPKHPQRPDRPTLEMCLGASALALSLIMAGTGDLAVLRLLRQLRFKIDTELTYGNHMAIGMAIGLLFCSGGRATICRSNEAIAALLVSLYPFFPTNTTDNRYHMQALRHLYVLAMDPRCLEVVDVDTNQAVPAPLVLELKRPFFSLANHQHPHPHPHNNNNNNSQQPMNSSLTLSAPCMLPEIESIRKITLDDPRYFPVTLNLDTFPQHLETLRAFKCIFVKRKKGLLSYAQDPSPAGLRSVLFRSVQLTRGPLCSHTVQKRLQAGNLADFGETPPGAQLQRFAADGEAPAGKGGHDLERLLKNFTNDEQIMALYRLFCKSEDICPEACNCTYSDMSLAGFCWAIVQECLSGGKSEILPVYLSLYHGSNSLDVSSSNKCMWDVKLLCTYYDCLPWKVVETSSGPGQAVSQKACTNGDSVVSGILKDPLLKVEYLHAVRNRFEVAFENLGFQRIKHDGSELSEFGQYLQTGDFGSAKRSTTTTATAAAATTTTSKDIGSVITEDGFSHSQRAIHFGSFLDYFDIPHPSALSIGPVRLVVTLARFSSYIMPFITIDNFSAI